MGAFVGTAIVEYRLSFSDQGKQTSIFHFCLQQTNGSLPFPFSIHSKQTKVANFGLWTSGNMETWTLRYETEETWRWRHGHEDGDIATWRHENMEKWRHGDMETWRHGNGDIDMET
jgi:hypothetical protein